MNVEKTGEINKEVLANEAIEKIKKESNRKRS